MWRQCHWLIVVEGKIKGLKRFEIALLERAVKELLFASDNLN